MKPKKIIEIISFLGISEQNPGQHKADKSQTTIRFFYSLLRQSALIATVGIILSYCFNPTIGIILSYCFNPTIGFILPVVYIQQ